MHPSFTSVSARHAALSIILCLGGFWEIRAQDVTVTAPEWVNSDNVAIAHAPRFKHRPSLDYPSELQESEEQGYGIISCIVDARGSGPSVIRAATHPHFFNLLDNAAAELTLIPAKMGDKVVDGLCWFAVIFNPAAASPKGDNAKPRLLAVTPTWVPAELSETSNSTDRPVVWATMKVDEEGHPHNLALESPAHERFLPAMQQALKSWRIAPARRGGIAVSSEFRAPFMIVRQLKPYALGKLVLPKLLKLVQPVYPPQMLSNRKRAEVVVDFMVTTEGKVVDASVFRSDNPQFEEAALESIRQWTFKPGRRDGNPVSTRMQQSVVFSIEDAPGGGDEAYAVARPRDDSKLPPALKFDVPAKIRGVIIPVYPYALRREGVRGKVKAAMLIDANGHVVGVRVLEATRPEFGLALTAALEMFSFDPALKNGTPTKSLVGFEQDFDRRDIKDSEGERLLEAEKKHPEKIVLAELLDAPLKLISGRIAIFPISLAAQTKEGKAMVEMLVDQDGHVRLPRVISATKPAFGYAAVQAVAQWRFESPKVKGKTVTARIRAPFEFRLSAAPAAMLESAP